MTGPEAQGVTKDQYIRRYIAKIRRESGLNRGFARGSAYATWEANARKGRSNAHPESDAADMVAYLRGLRGEQP